MHQSLQTFLQFTNSISICHLLLVFFEGFITKGNILNSHVSLSGIFDEKRKTPSKLINENHDSDLSAKLFLFRKMDFAIFTSYKK